MLIICAQVLDVYGNIIAIKFAFASPFVASLHPLLQVNQSTSGKQNRKAENRILITFSDVVQKYLRGYGVGGALKKYHEIVLPTRQPSLQNKSAGNSSPIRRSTTGTCSLSASIEEMLGRSRPETTMAT